MNARPLGYRKDGRPIFRIAGGSEPPAPAAAPPATPVPGAPVTPPAAPPASDPPAAATPTPGPFDSWDGKVESLPEDAQRIIRDARKEAGDYRAEKNAETERIKAILKAAGIETEEDDPVKVLETTRGENASLRAEMTQMRVERALTASAKKSGADEDLVIAVLAHKGKLRDLDPEAEGFATKLDRLVEAEVKANPKLKAARAAAASGAEFTGGPGDQADIDSQIAEATKAGNHRLAIALKRQKAYAASA